MKSKTHEDSRARMLSFATAARTILAVNPKTGLTSLAKQVGCDWHIPAQLKSLGVIEDLGEAGSKWASKDSDDVVVDKLIIFRRGPEPSTLTPEQLANLELRLLRLEQANEAMGTKLAQLGLPADLQLSEEDRVLIEMAINDAAQLRARLNTIDANVTELIKRSFSAGVTPRKEEPLQRVVVPKKWKLGVVGIFERDWGHLKDHVGQAMNGHAKNVEMVRIDHLEVPARIPSGMDGILITQDGMKHQARVREIYPQKTYFVKGGLKTTAGQIALICDVATQH